jgi:hypothetical protein
MTAAAVSFKPCDNHTTVSAVTVEQAAGETILAISGVSDRHIEYTETYPSDDPATWYGVIPQFFFVATHTGGTIPRPTFNGELCGESSSSGMSSHGFDCPLEADQPWTVQINLTDVPGVRLESRWTAYGNALGGDWHNVSEEIACIDFTFRVPL